jgi:hypothetical protein
MLLLIPNSRASCSGSLPSSVNPCHGLFSVTDPTTGHNYRVSARR